MFISNSKFYVKSTITSTQWTWTTFLISEDFETWVHIETSWDVVSIVLKTTTQIERLTITSVWWTATIVERWLTQVDTKVEDSWIQKQWTDWTIWYITALASDLLDIDASWETVNINSDITFTWWVDFQDTMNLPVFADTTARDVVYTSPVDWDKCFITWTWEQYYDSWTWNTLGTWTPTPNASVTVAWKVEISTSAQSILAIDTWETWALLDVLPSDIAKNTQSWTFVYKTDTAIDDDYLVALVPTLTAYTKGMKLSFEAQTANTWACTLKINALAVINIKTRSWNDPIDWDIWANEIVTVVYDWTNFVLQSRVDSEIRTLADEIIEFWWNWSDWAISWALTITWSNNTIIEKNYTSFAPWNNTVTVTPTWCIVYIRVNWDCDLTDTTFDFTGKWTAWWWAQSAGTSTTALITESSTWGGWAPNLTNWGGGWWWASCANDWNTWASWGGGSPWAWWIAWHFLSINWTKLRWSIILWPWAWWWWASVGGWTWWEWWWCVILEVLWNLTFNTTVINCDWINWAASSQWWWEWWGWWGAFLVLYKWTLSWSPTIDITGWSWWASWSWWGWAGWVGWTWVTAVIQIN